MMFSSMRRVSLLPIENCKEKRNEVFTNFSEGKINNKTQKAKTFV